MEIKYNITAICLQCWNQISEFHDFQKSVYRAQKKLIDDDDKASKTPVLNSQRNSSKGPYSQANNNGPTIIKDEQDYIHLPEIEVIDIHDDDDDREFVSDCTEFVVTEISDESEQMDEQAFDNAQFEQYKFTCELCGDSHTSERDLNIHIKYWHTQVKKKPKARRTESNFPCDECGKSLRSAVSLYKHKWYHRKMKLKFTCSFCQDMFLNGNRLRDHLRTAHPDKEVESKHDSKLHTNQKENHSIVYQLERENTCSSPEYIL